MSAELFYFQGFTPKKDYKKLAYVNIFLYLCIVIQRVSYTGDTENLEKSRLNCKHFIEMEIKISFNLNGIKVTITLKK